MRIHVCANKRLFMSANTDDISSQAWTNYGTGIYVREGQRAGGLSEATVN